MNIPAPIPTFTKKYSNFKGVDFTSQEVSQNHFPYAKNFIITDMIEKRPGWKVLHDFQEEIHGIFNTVMNGIEYFLIHAGDKLYSIVDEVTTELITGLNKGKSTGFYGGDKYYILTGKEYLQFDGTEVKKIDGTESHLDSFAYAPLEAEGRTMFDTHEPYVRLSNVSYDTVVSRQGTLINEAHNLLTNYRAIKCNAWQRSSASSYSLLAFGNEAVLDSVVYIKYDDGTEKTGRVLSGTTSDGVRVYFMRADDTSENVGKPFTAYYKYKETDEVKVWETTATSHIQYGNGVYFFFTGNPNKPNTDWQSALNDPTYIPSDNYTIYGTEDEILGYGQYGQYLAVFKKGNKNTNIYVRYAREIDGLGVTFPTEIGVGGALGGISRSTISNLEGETLYLTNEGIYALTSLSTTNQKVTRNRSYFVDNALLKEIDLQNAVATTWNNKYVLAVNGKMYILDGSRQKTYVEGFTNDYVYECLFWDNIPATSLLSSGNTLYFGTSDGKLCVFSDNYEDSGEPIETIICTKLDDDGDFMSFKKLMKKGSGLLLQPYARSSFDIAYRYDTYEEVNVKTVYGDILNFDDIDFDRFTFESNDNPRVIPFLKKSKKYKSLQIIIRSQNKEPLGLMGIIKRFEFNNYVKR